MVELMKFINEVLHWDVCFFRAVHDWGLEALSSFMDTIYGFCKGDWGGKNELETR